MDENKKKSPEEEEKKTPDTSEEKKDEPKPDDKPADKADEPKQEEKSPDDKQADENGEGADKPDEKQDKPNEQQEPKSEAEKEESPAAADDKDEEILRLKTQIAAMQLGFKPECMEDAVVLAKSYVENGEKDINTALSAVMKKYPDWKQDGKSDKNNGGFKVGADSSDKGDKADDNRLSNAFGIRKKK